MSCAAFPCCNAPATELTSILHTEMNLVYCVIGAVGKHYFFFGGFGIFTVSVTVVDGRRLASSFGTNCPVRASRVTFLI